MMKFLKFANFLLIICLLCNSCSKKPLLTSTNNCWFPVYGCEKQEVIKFNSEFKFRDIEITGITIIKKNDNNIVGTVMNEFGIKAFDFEIKNGKCKLINVVSYINKWYIKQTIQKDLIFIQSNVNITETNHYKSGSNDGYWVFNKRRNIKYHFRII
ncbi:hypothetical protein LJC30_01730 [Odoribacter sp. OttesenSCG-928-L07]|nr:hypothetical protein [Odoribacter sp. OttesenSCG-928-L07]MDL2238886.1 hypothetical protein [Bacteroidales bacterium OttesenSCG-928-L14]MDL2240626.1 hypothetical protein [Bacteroidales bacterium OttesenSCG-928-K22]